MAGLNADGMQYRGYPLSKVQQDLDLVFLRGAVQLHALPRLQRPDAERQGQALESLGSSGFEQTNFDLLADFSRGMSDDMMYLSLVYNPQVFDERADRAAWAVLRPRLRADA